MKKISWNLFGTVLVLSLSAACGDDSPTDRDASASDASAGDSSDGETDAAAPLEPTYETVATVLRTSCTFRTACHGGTGAGRGLLNFEQADDLREVLVNVPACGNNAMNRVEPGAPDQSWLIVKIGAHSTITWDDEGMIALEGTPPADERAGCPTAEGFGRLMPENRGGITLISEERRTAIREWVALGAPGPAE